MTESAAVNVYLQCCDIMIYGATGKKVVIREACCWINIDLTHVGLEALSRTIDLLT